MIYNPVNHTPDELLKRAGYTRDFPQMGWMRMVKGQHGNPYERLHATTHEGNIKLHADMVIGKQHISKSHVGIVRREIKALRKLDLSTGESLTEVLHAIMGDEDSLKNSDATSGT